MDIKAILLDFDGTTLQRDQTFISFRNMAALRKAMDRGIEIIPCTGRCEDMFPPQIEAEKRIHYWVTASGARVVDRNTKEVIYQSLFTPEESAALCRIYENREIYSEIAAEGLIYMEESVCSHLEDFPVPPHHVWFLEKGRQIAVDLSLIHIYGPAGALQGEDGGVHRHGVKIPQVPQGTVCAGPHGHDLL